MGTQPGFPRAPARQRGPCRVVGGPWGTDAGARPEPPRRDLQGGGARGGRGPRQYSPAVSAMEAAGTAHPPAGPEHLRPEALRPAGPAPTGEAKPPPPPCRPPLVRPPFPSAPAGRRELRPRESEAVGGSRRSCPSERAGAVTLSSSSSPPEVTVEPGRDSNHSNKSCPLLLFVFALSVSLRPSPQPASFFTLLPVPSPGPCGSRSSR